MKVLKYPLTVIIFVILFFAAQRLFVPKYAESAYEGGLIREYYDEETYDHDVLFIGDCEIYENISPVTLWEEYGITSFIRGSAQQTIWQSYYLLEDALRYEKPDAVVFNVLAMQYAETQREEYTRLTLDGMRLSESKMKAVEASLTEGESSLSYLFPLLRFHDRWNELSLEDLKYYFTKPPVSFNGFMVRCDVMPVNIEDLPTGMKLPDYRFGENAYKYLDEMTKICKDNNIELILIKAPILYPEWYPEWDAQMASYAEENHLRYYNFINNLDDIGLDFTQDTYDGGLHLNVYGAEKFTSYLGEILRRENALPDRRGEAETARRWAVKSAAYEEMKAAQLKDIQETGKVETFLIN
ncbi:MAG: SGNH/GDSL hydrolase family protein [Clostridiales bacterium]|nr:SGNH/GDSL hydrolase family protein [Clostridiales bacterium]